LRDHPSIDLSERVIHDPHLNPRLTPRGRRHL
jgi:hypothetical protein